jgi:hypothetical protein
VLLTVYCVVFGGVNCLRSWLAGPDRREFTPPVYSIQSTAHSHSTIKCNLSVTTTKVLPEDGPAGSKHVGCVTSDDKTLFVHLLVISVFV